MIDRIQPGRLHSERGQALVLVAVGMVAVCAMAGFSIDLSVWYRAQRKQQSIVDAAALAAASSLPTNTGEATTAALDYALKNGGSASLITYSTRYLSNDTVTVQAQATVPAYFLKALGFNSTTVTATAVARAANLGAAYGVAPFAVSNAQPELAGPGCPCFGITTTLELARIGPGGFEIVDIDGSQGATGPGTLAGWIVRGCSCTTAAPVWLFGDPGAKFDSSEVKDAMDHMVGHTLLVPVYDETRGTGANLEYHVIGFTGFTFPSFRFSGILGTVTGHFTKVDWAGSGTNSAGNYFGAITTQLVG
jgi:Flp pilus assembly protein TadG